MDISIEDLLKNIAKSDDIIQREKLNKELYQKTLLNKINEELKPLKYFTEIVNTPSKFIEYANGCGVYDVSILSPSIDYFIYCSYKFRSNGKLYQIILPLKYRDMEELIPHMLEDKNYCKVRLYEMDGCCHKILGYFDDVKSAINSIRGQI